MLYLLWGLLNLVLFLLFIWISVGATRLIRQRLGLVAAAFFVIGLLSFLSKPWSSYDNKESGTDRVRKWRFAAEDSLELVSTHPLNVTLGRNMLHAYDLGITYGKTKEGSLAVPIEAYSRATGWIGGTNWKPLAITVNGTNDNAFYYSVQGIEEWTILGIPLTTQRKTFAGTAELHQHSR